MITKTDLQKMCASFSSNENVHSTKITHENNLYVYVNDNHKHKYKHNRLGEHKYMYNAVQTVIMIRKSPFGNGNFTVNIRKVNAFYTYHFKNTYATVDELITAVEKYIAKIIK